MQPLRRHLTLPAALLPGALFGAHLTGLLYFLNPDQPLTATRLLLGVLLYGGTCALLGAALQAPWLLSQPQRALRALPWFVSFVLASVAALLALHASFYAYLLPPGVNTRLIKASLVLAFAGLAAFYTALLHSLSNRPYGRRSRWFLWLLALGSLYVMVERREAYRPRLQQTLASSVEEPRSSLLVVVSLEGASLDIVLPLSEQGSLPFFAETLRVGSFARLRTQSLPPEALLTTLVSGKWPYKHGIVDSLRFSTPPFPRTTELRLLPLGARRVPWILGGRASRPTDADDRQAMTAWEITSRLGLASATAGWPETLTSSDKLLFSVPGNFSSPAGNFFTVEDSLEGDAPASSLSSTALSDFPPDYREIVRYPLGRDGSLASEFASLAGETPAAEALFLNLPGLASVSARFAGAYSRVPFEGAGRADFSTEASTLAAYYRWLDTRLAALWASTSQPATLVIVSAHGFSASPWWRHRGQQGRMSRGVVDSDADGLLMVRGGGVRSAGFVADASIEDVLPTLLYAVGLPIARDLDGHVLTGLFEPHELTARPLSFLPSYETIVGERPTGVPPLGTDSAL